MDELKDFKSIADEIMSDICAGEDLKRRTLAQCKRKNHSSAGKILIPAACLLLTFGLLNISGILPLWNQAAKEENTEMNILVDSAQDAAKDAEAIPESAASALVQDNLEGITWILNTTEEAEKQFGSAFLAPDYVPEEYQLNQVQASGADKSSADKIVLSYLSEDKAFYIIEEKTTVQEEISDYKVISIHGTSGYIKAFREEEENLTGNLFTELHWYNDGVHYSVSGQITEEEAVKVAEKMS